MSGFSGGFTSQSLADTMFVISIAALKRNTAILRAVKEAAGCHVVLALKGFSCWKAFPYLRDDLEWSLHCDHFRGWNYNVFIPNGGELLYPLYGSSGVPEGMVVAGRGFWHHGS